MYKYIRDNAEIYVQLFKNSHKYKGMIYLN